MASQQNNDIELLKREIERLTRELDQASSEKVQSAQYGLVLLEEKKELQQKCEEFENLYENTKHDLTITQEVLQYKFNLFGFVTLIVFRHWQSFSQHTK